MTGAIPNFQASVSGSPLQAARQKERARKAAQAKANPRSADDSFELTEQVEHVDAVRETEHATSEETREDHQEHAAGYDAAGGSKKRAAPRIDLEG
ncbi:MAG: hypothetical protein ACF8Q5_06690 [Phycisphaerales bacterium JB040]